MTSVVVLPHEVSSAYDACEAITRREAKNFAYGIRLLRPPERRAMSAAYALARRIDDVGDGEGSPADKLAGLDRLREQFSALEAYSRSGPRREGDTQRASGAGPTDARPFVGDLVIGDPVLLAVADAAATYGIPIGAFREIVDGCEMDVRGTTYETIDDLVVYCRLVAGSVGRISLAVFGPSDPDVAAPFADALGVALQLTNILRDVVEDKAMGRVYLPRLDAREAGCPADLDAAPDTVARLVEVECAIARRWFEEGLRLLPLLDRRSRACVSAMAGIYQRLLERIAADPAAVLRGRVSLPAREKLWVAARSIAVARP